MTDKTKLEEEGWEKRSVVSDKRVDEFVDLYKSLGFEVLVEKLNAENFEGCPECAGDSMHACVIYVRKKD